MSNEIEFKPEVGKTFTLNSTSHWCTVEGNGVETNVSEFRITYVDDHRFDYELVRTVSVENPMPGTTGREVRGGCVILRHINTMFIPNLV